MMLLYFLSVLHRCTRNTSVPIPAVPTQRPFSLARRASIKNGVQVVPGANRTRRNIFDQSWERSQDYKSQQEDGTDARVPTAQLYLCTWACTLGFFVAPHTSVHTDGYSYCYIVSIYDIKRSLFSPTKDCVGCATRKLGTPVLHIWHCHASYLWHCPTDPVWMPYICMHLKPLGEALVLPALTTRPHPSLIFTPLAHIFVSFTHTHTQHTLQQPCS